MDSRPGAGIAQLYTDRIDGGIFAPADEGFVRCGYQRLVDAASCHNSPLDVFRTVLHTMYIHTIIGRTNVQSFHLLTLNNGRLSNVKRHFHENWAKISTVWNKCAYLWERSICGDSLIVN